MERQLAQCVVVVLLVLQCEVAFAQVLAPSAAATEAPDAADATSTSCLNDPDLTSRCHSGRREIQIPIKPIVTKKGEMSGMFPSGMPARKEQKEAIIVSPVPGNPEQQ